MPGPNIPRMKLKHSICFKCHHTKLSCICILIEMKGIAAEVFQDLLLKSRSARTAQKYLKLKALKCALKWLMTIKSKKNVENFG